MRIDNALAQISKHKHLIIVVIGVAAIASYMIPFANLLAVADATSSGWWNFKHKKVDMTKDHVKKKFDFKFAKFFKNLFIKNLLIDNSERTTNIFKNLGVQQFFSFDNINTASNGGTPSGTTGTLFPSGTLTSPSGSIALNAGTTFIFFQNIQNCPAAAGSGSGSLSVASTSCTQTATTQIQSNPYVTFGGSA
jgi:hypothetical protein